MIHPNNRFDRLRIKKKKDEQKTRKEKRKADRLWRLQRERDKVKDTEDEIRSATQGSVDFGRLD